MILRTAYIILAKSWSVRVALEEDLGEDLRAAMRAGDTIRRDAIRQLRATLHNEAIARGQPLGPDDAVAVVRRLVNQHRDSIAEFTRGGRADLVDREQAELDVLLGYLPADLSREAIAAAAQEVVQRLGASGRGDQGRVMRELAPQLRGKADMRLVNEVVQELLG
jgi:uncharacterized protein YqeY